MVPIMTSPPRKFVRLCPECFGDGGWDSVESPRVARDETLGETYREGWVVCPRCGGSGEEE